MTAYDVSSWSNTDILNEIDHIMEAGEEMDVEAAEYLLDILQARAPVMVDFDAEQLLEETFQMLDQWINLVQTDPIDYATYPE